jgi:hypothetical protein
MTARKTTIPLAITALCCGWILAADSKPPSGAYTNDFQKTELGKPPEDLFVLRGDFTVREDGGNRFLELPGDPVEGYGLLFGPEGQQQLDVSAKVYGTSRGKLFPEFGIGANDAGGYKLWVLPGLQKVQLRKGEDPTPLAEAEYKAWQSGQWTNLRLRVSQSGGKWKVEGKAWPAAGQEPPQWTISLDAPQAPSAGRASVWGSPYSGTPIRFDDLKATPVGAGK